MELCRYPYSRARSFSGGAEKASAIICLAEELRFLAAVSLAMSTRNGFEFRIHPIATGWAWSTYEQGSGRKLVEGAVATRAQAAACVIQSIATRAGAGEERAAPRTEAERARGGS